MTQSNFKAISLGATLLLGAATAHAGPISVFVGYADNLRPTGFFPAGWIGTTGAVSETPDGQSLDAGAVRIDNNSGAPITISNFTVFLPNAGATFNLWSPLAIPNGGHGIFTQTSSYNFDTSDFGQFGGLPPPSLYPTIPGNTAIGGCSSTAAIIALAGYTAACNATAPRIDFDDNLLNHYTFFDSGHILNTGDWDFANNGFFGEDGNESINWNLVGSEPVRGGNIPEPGSLSLLGLGLLGLCKANRGRG